MPQKTLSIVIVTWNTAKITLECIKSIDKHLPKNFYEIIVVDNASTDDTESLLKSNFPQIIYLKNQSNLGFSKANNIGASEASGKYLLFLNSDMVVTDDCFVDMVNYFEKHENVGAIGPLFLNADHTIQASVFPKQNITNAIKEFWFHKSTYSKYSPKTVKPIKVWSVSGGAILLKKYFFNQIGKWDEKYFFYFEDIDLCRSIHKFGKDIIFYPKCKVIHYHGASGKKIVDSKNQWRRLIPGSIKYHGYFQHYAINFIIWSGQKWQKILNLLH